ncbi:radical SAM protein [Methanofollis fontis]|uniref:Radical SAM protein n=1 Tax=Methanofollis fontis TaxID=2052832 RepID=A0A483CT98_9EURY|nr:radical SAM protein [Methanofollis fontis]TAJ43904.1 radical SAM protein [Methanofollis fontis]
MTYQYLFGPVPSRRLGASLGIDLVPLKTCSYNCIYCECGRTTDLTLERREYVPTAGVIDELRRFLGGAPALDFITCAGSGEPTLHSGIGEIIRFLKHEFPAYRVAVLTNGSLLSDPAVREEIMPADLVIPTLNAVSEEAFRRICRPYPDLTAAGVNAGIRQFAADYSGALWLEVFIVPGINDSDEEIDRIDAEIRAIAPDKVQLNTLDRPGAVPWVTPADDDALDRIAGRITGAPVEIVGRLPSRATMAAFHDEVVGFIMTLVRRRPATVMDISRATGLHTNEVNKYIQYLLEEGEITVKKEERGSFFLPRKG